MMTPERLAELTAYAQPDTMAMEAMAEIAECHQRIAAQQQPAKPDPNAKYHGCWKSKDTETKIRYDVATDTFDIFCSHRWFTNSGNAQHYKPLIDRKIFLPHPDPLATVPDPSAPPAPVASAERDGDNDSWVAPDAASTLDAVPGHIRCFVVSEHDKAMHGLVSHHHEQEPYWPPFAVRK